MAVQAGGLCQAAYVCQRQPCPHVCKHSAMFTLQSLLMEEHGLTLWCSQADGAGNSRRVWGQL